MALYNLTGIVAGNETSMLTFIQGVNTELMGGWLGSLFLLGIGIVLFGSIIYKTNDIGKAMATTMFILFSLAMPLVALELLAPLGLFITLIGAALGVATTWNRE